MQSPKLTISVIVPTLQEEKYIEAILQKLNRIKPKIETIVVDGGSQDRTTELAKRFTKRVYQTQKQGIAAGRNYGAKMAKGDILVFLDTDVTFPVTLAQRVLDAFSDPSVVGATCNIMPLNAPVGATVFFKAYNVILRLFTKFKPHSRGEFLAVRNSAFQSIDGFDETMPCLEDHDLANRLSKLGRFVFISDLTVYESFRRFRKLGFRRVVWTWFTDYIFFVVRGKPISAAWSPIR